MQTKLDDPVARWAEYVLTHPDWKKIHTQFINAQFEKSHEFYKRLAKTNSGQEILRELRLAKV
jgi:hypothetical protein